MTRIIDRIIQQELSAAIEFLTLVISFPSNLSLSTCEHLKYNRPLKGHDSLLQIKIVYHLKRGM